MNKGPKPKSTSPKPPPIDLGLDRFPIGKSTCCLDDDKAAYANGQNRTIRLFLYSPMPSSSLRGKSHAVLDDEDAEPPMNTTHYTDYETRKALRDRITSLLKRKRYSFKNENEQECVDNDTPACEIRPPAGTPIEKVRKDIQAACKQCGTMADKYASREEGGLQRT